LIILLIKKSVFCFSTISIVSLLNNRGFMTAAYHPNLFQVSLADQLNSAVGIAITPPKKLSKN
jgi:hypothetical protein